jgi:aryl-alcohol dehydrogenase-like predicted oxidoreductase
MNDIAKRPLGRTGLEVTVLGYGAMELRGAGPRNPRPLPEGEAGRVLNAVLDAGINFVDTSIDYGQSEELIGRHIGHRRDEYLLATEAGCPWDATTLAQAPPGPLPHDFSPGHIRAGVERSLRLLKTDHLDLVQLHMSPSAATIQSEGAIGTPPGGQHRPSLEGAPTAGRLPGGHTAVGCHRVLPHPPPVG